MRTAINVTPRTRSFQTGGVFGLDPEGMPVTPPVTPVQQANPNQPPPGQAGPITPATPPPTIPPPATPPAGIDTSTYRYGTPPPASVPAYDDEADTPQADLTEQEAFKARVSHRGDGTTLVPQPPALNDEQHAEYRKLEQMKEIYPRLTAKPDLKEARSAIDKLEARIKRETAKANDAAYKQWYEKEKSELRKVDAHAYGVTDIGKLDEGIKSALDKDDVRFQTAIEQGGAEARHEAEERRAAGPLNTFKDNPEQFSLIAKNLMALNQHLNLSPEAAARFATQLVTPPRRGQKGLNGYTGRAAANYRPRGKDLVDNVGLDTQLGFVRLSEPMYQIVKNARVTGFNNAAKYQEEVRSKREEEARPGWVSRNVLSPLLNR